MKIIKQNHLEHHESHGHNGCLGHQAERNNREVDKPAHKY